MEEDIPTELMHENMMSWNWIMFWVTRVKSRFVTFWGKFEKGPLHEIKCYKEGNADSVWNLRHRFYSSWFQTKAGKVVWMVFEIISLFKGYFLMTVKSIPDKTLKITNENRLL